MDEKERYEKIDLPFYQKNIAPIIPEEVLDFHTHVWRIEHWKSVPWRTEKAGARYLVTEEHYDVEQLLADGKRIFPDRKYSAVVFGYPSPAADLEKTNEYASTAVAKRGLYPLIITGKGVHSRKSLERFFEKGICFGYKVFLNWLGDDYGNIKIEDMLGQEEMVLADEYRLIVLLHVPGRERIADPEVQRGVAGLAEKYRGASIVLAHCGRAFQPDIIMGSLDSLKDFPNIYFDTSMVMDPTVFEVLFDTVGPQRVLFGTDFPVAAMRGRRIYVMDHWVDVVLEGYPPSAFRIASNGIRATFMVYEIALAIARACYMCGLDMNRIRDIFYNNGMSLLEKAMNGEQLRKAQSLWR
ncbi:MAG: amidohydrolase family protein [Spirochaetota bacterium]